MNLKQIGLEIVLLGFAAFTGYCLYEYGTVGLFKMAFANAVSTLLFTDLTISLVIVLVWLGADAEEHHISMLPYIALTLMFGSVGPLLYLIRRAGHEEREHRIDTRVVNG